MKILEIQRSQWLFDVWIVDLNTPWRPDQRQSHFKILYIGVCLHKNQESDYIDIFPPVRSLGRWVYTIQAVVTSLDYVTRAVKFPIWNYFFLLFSNCLQAVWKYSNERIMNWMQEAARRIDISKRSFLIETISSQYVTYAFSHLYPSTPSLCEHQRFWSF